MVSHDSARSVPDGRARTPRRAAAVPLALGGVFVASLAALSACSPDDSTERCVDMRSHTVIDDKYCEDTSATTSYAHWYTGGSGFAIGSKVSGGEEGEHGVARGGFGGHGEGGDGDGGGHAGG